MTRPRHPALAPALLAALLPALAFADSATAEALFREARKLLAEGQVSAACEKLAASQRLDPSSGTLLNLASCHAKEGKTATAWAEFTSAITMAKSQGNATRVAEAEKRAKELEGQLTYVTFKVTSKAPGMTIARDGVVLEPATWDSKIPVDPGKHTLVASAPGHVDWKATIEAGKAGVQEIVVPALEKKDDEPAPAPSTSASATAPRGSAEPVSRQPTGPDQQGGHSATLGYVVGGVGLAVTVVGVIFGVKSLGSYGDAEDLCPTHKGCPEGVTSKYNDAKSAGTISTIAVGLGAAGIVTGTVLVLTAKGGKPDTGLRLSPQVGQGFGGALVGGRF